MDRIVPLLTATLVTVSLGALTGCGSSPRAAPADAQEAQRTGSAPHPLDPLTADEISSATALLGRAGLIRPSS
jgi:hypothetical protein